MKKASVFDLTGTPPLGQVVPLGFQHVMAAIVGVVTPALLVAGTCNLSESDKILLVQASLLITALCTVLQTFSIGGWVGAALPCFFGVSFAYVPTLLSIGQTFNIATILGAQVIGGIVAIIFGILLKYVRPLFPPLVAGTVVFAIGLSLYPTAVKYMAGGAGSANYGSAANWIVALITFGCTLGFNAFGKGLLKLSSILGGMICGYVVAFFMGMVDFSAIHDAGLFYVVTPLHFGLEFHGSAIATMAIMYIVNSVQAIGDLTAVTMGGMNRQPTDKELSGGIIGNGVVSSVGALFGGLPIASYSQNVGITATTGVINRMVFLFAAVVVGVAGVVPKFSALLTTIPQAVIGGATLSVFASIAMTGIRVISEEKLTPRNTLIVGISIAFGAGVVQAPGCLDGLPVWVNNVFGSSAVIITTIMAVILNLIIPKTAMQTTKPVQEDAKLSEKQD